MADNPFDKFIQERTNPSPLGQVTDQSQGQDTNPFDAYLQVPKVNVPTPGWGGTIVSTLSPIADFLSRPQYASARFFDSMMDTSKGLMDAISDSFGEFLDPKLKMSFADLIKKRAPEFAKNNPIATSVMGFALDIALDPTSYLFIGSAGKGVLVGTKVATRVGEGALGAIRASIPAREYITAVGKNLTREIQLAADRGLKASIQELTPMRLNREIIALSREYGDEFKRLGMTTDKAELRRLASAELGIEKIPLPTKIKDLPFTSRTVTGLVEDVVDDLSLDIDRAMRKAREIGQPKAPYPGQRMSGGFKVPGGDVVRKNELIPVGQQGAKTTYKYGETVKPRYVPNTPETAKGLATKKTKRLGEMKRPPSGTEYLSPPASLQANAPMREDIERFAVDLIEKKLGGLKRSLTATDEQFENLRGLVGRMVNVYVNAVDSAITAGAATRTIKTEFTSNLRNMVKRALKPGEKPPINPRMAKMYDDVEKALPLADAGKGPFAQATQIPNKIEYSRGVVRQLSVEEIRDKAETRMLAIAQTRPEEAAKWFRPEGVKPRAIGVELPFTGMKQELLDITGLTPLKRSIDFTKKFYEATILKADTISRNAERMGQTRRAKLAKGAVAALAVPGKVAAMRHLFSRPQDEPWKGLITGFENQLDYIEGQVFRSTRKMFDTLPAEGRDRLTKVLSEIDDKTRTIEFQEGRVVTQAEATSIFNTAIDKVGIDIASGDAKGIKRVGMTADEMSIISSLKQEYANISQLEMEANLLKSQIKNYHPRYYEAIEDSADMVAITRVKYGLATNLTSSQKRKFVTQAEAVAAGLIPEMDAAMIYATRVAASRRALVKKQFFENVGHVFGLDIKNQNDLAKLASIPGGGRYLDDIKLLGESVYPEGMNEATKAFLKFIDTTTGMFKRAGTVWKPSFAPKQAISNTVQIMMGLGIKGMKTFDPRAFTDIAMLLAQTYAGEKRTTLPKFLTNFFNKHFGETVETGADAVLAGRVSLARMIGEEALQDVADGYKMITAFGDEYKGADLVRIMRENGVVRGTDSLGDTFKRSLKESLEYDPKNKWSVTQELAKFWKYPSIVEDYGRAVAFTGFLRQGYNVKQAVQKTNDVLFDYMKGLSHFEQKYAKKFVPFYSYSRFAIPFVLKHAMGNPGQVAAYQKVANLMEKLLVEGSSDTLNPSEREVFGESFWMEQPRIFSGFSKDGKAKFNILNNLTPLDALNLFVYDSKTNKFDLQRTMEKTVLAALTPYLKVPIELVLDKNFFTDKAVSQGTQLGDLSQSLSQVVPQWAKDLMGWEDRVNLRTRQTKTYVNTWLAYSMVNAVPALKQWVNTVFDQSRNPLDRAMEIITGIKPVDVDIKELRQWQALGDNKRAREIQDEIRSAKIRGANTDFERNLKDYREFLQTIREGNNLKRQFDIRGQGIGGNATSEISQEPR